MRRGLAILAALAGVLVLAGSSAAQAPPKGAVAAALQALGVSAHKGAVVYHSPAPLAPGTVVAEAGPALLRGSGKLTAAVRGWTLTRRSWLFWADFDPGADFSHPSALALVDAANGRVLVHAALTWYPLVNGKPLVRRAADPALVVHAPLRPALPSEQDCMVTAADVRDPRRPTNFHEDASAMSVWASGRDIFQRTATDGAGMAGAVGGLIANGCNDVVLLLAGHGLGAPGTRYHGMKIATSKDPTVVTSQEPVLDARGRQVVHNGKPVIRITAITATDIRKIIETYRTKAHFKLIVDSCFGARFQDALSDLQKGADPPLREFLSSASAGEPATRLVPDDRRTESRPGYFVESLVKALDDVQKDPQLKQTANGDLATELELAAELVKEHPEKYGNKVVERKIDHPVNTFSGPAVPTPPAESSTLTLSPISSVFDPSRLATVYTVQASTTTGAKIDTTWELELHVLPEDAGKGAPGEPDSRAGVDAGCNNALLTEGQKSGSNSYLWTREGLKFVWFHGDKGSYKGETYGCQHQLMGPHGHQGTVTITATDGRWTCTASADGTNLSTTPVTGEPATCKRR